MTAFYMFRLMAMTFFGGYRGPAWETARRDDDAAHGVASGRPTRTAQAHDARSRTVTPRRDDDDGGGHGHGPWHGPHESPRPMTYPLMALAVGAMVAGFVGIPAALCGTNAIEHFLEPSFTRSRTLRVEAAERRRRAGEPRSGGAARGRQSTKREAARLAASSWG